MGTDEIQDTTYDSKFLSENVKTSKTSLYFYRYVAGPAHVQPVQFEFSM